MYTGTTVCWYMSCTFVLWPAKYDICTDCLSLKVWILYLWSAKYDFCTFSTFKVRALYFCFSAYDILTPSPGAAINWCFDIISLSKQSQQALHHHHPHQQQLENDNYDDNDDNRKVWGSVKYNEDNDNCDNDHENGDNDKIMIITIMITRIMSSMTMIMTMMMAGRL